MLGRHNIILQMEFIITIVRCLVVARPNKTKDLIEPYKSIIYKRFIIVVIISTSMYKIRYL